MQIVSEPLTDGRTQKQIVQMRWGKPYGTPIPALERRVSAKMGHVSIAVTDQAQKEIARRMNVRLPTVEHVLSKYWRNGFRYPVSD